MATHRREARAARRADLSGSGPTREERPPARFPGATAKFELLGEVMLIGLLVTIVSLPLITLPAALAAGIRHLRRYIEADGSPISAFWRDLVRALPGGLVVGLVTLALTAILLLDIDLANSGALPGGAAIAIAGWVGLAVVAVSVLVAAAAWSPELGWKRAVRGVGRTLVTDIPGTLYLAATAAFVVVCTWALPPLVIPAIGCAALAVIAVPMRARRARA
ncbi:MAG TPA: hypothetical protein VFY91_00515 [Microbacterium sp.]|nr:hypothetical protein [Microbacterium sp.]